MTLYIHTGFLGGNLFSGLEPEPPDEAACCERYAALLEQALQDAYPDAVVTVAYQVSSVGTTPYNLQTDVLGSLSAEEEQDVYDTVALLENHIYDDFESWFVPLKP